jgi:type I site-specific restriction-modification system R (restriction) subunit
MANKRIRTTSTEAVTPVLDTVITPNETIPTQPNQYDYILQMVQDLQDKNKILEKRIAEAK